MGEARAVTIITAHTTPLEGGPGGEAQPGGVWGLRPR